MKITILCGVFDGGKPHGSKLGAFEREFPWYRGANDYDGLRWEERFYNCKKHGAVLVHEEDLLRLAINPQPPVIMALRDAARDHPRSAGTAL